jgi:hypothetical protein
MYAGSPAAPYGFSTTFTPTVLADLMQFDEVYVLTLPAFTWFKADYPAQLTRAWHTCHTVGNQMISFGGLDPSDGSLSSSDDPFPNGIGIFDMTTMQWTTNFDPNTKYQAPDVVNNYYYSNSTGPSNWASSDLKNLFVNSNIKFTGNPSKSANVTNSPGTVPAGPAISGTNPASPGSSGSSGSGSGGANASTSSSKKTNIGEIVGFSVLGVVAAGAFVTAIILLVLRRRQPAVVRAHREAAELEPSISDLSSVEARAGGDAYLKTPMSEFAGDHYYASTTPHELKGARPPSPQELIGSTPVGGPKGNGSTRWSISKGSFNPK